MNRILVVKMSSLGDVLHTLPALTDLKAALGEAVEVDWVVEEGYAAVPGWHAGLAEVIPVALRRWRREMNRAALDELGSYLGRLRLHDYAAILDVQGLFKSVLLGSLPARGPSHGYDVASIREQAASFLYGKNHSVSRAVHAVERSRQLFALALGYRLPSSQPDYGLSGTMRRGAVRDAVVLVPNAAHSRKLWLEERWIELGKLLRKDGLQVEVTWGNETELARARRIAAGCAGEVAGRLDLPELAAFLGGAKGMVSLDTGLAHMGAALGVPNVCLCVATDPSLSGAVGQHQVSVGQAGALSAAAAHAHLLRLLTATG